MKITTNTDSLIDCFSAFYGTSSYNARYTFSGKEKDTETGLSYFGSRYYSSDLSIWLSVDPLAGKYPSLSPYVYCAGNPVKLVDPNGEEIGDYYDTHGQYLGTDGKDDNKVYVVSDQASINLIVSNKRNKRENTSATDVSILISTTYDALVYSEQVFSRTDAAQGHREFAVAKNYKGDILSTEGSLIRESVALPCAEGEFLIHSHWYEYDADSRKYSTPMVPSVKDLEAFHGFEQNIIVGRDRPYSDINKYDELVSFYTSNPNPRAPKPYASLTRKALQSIIERYNRVYGTNE